MILNRLKLDRAKSTKCHNVNDLKLKLALSWLEEERFLSFELQNDFQIICSRKIAQSAEKCVVSICASKFCFLLKSKKLLHHVHVPQQNDQEVPNAVMIHPCSRRGVMFTQAMYTQPN